MVKRSVGWGFKVIVAVYIGPGCDALCPWSWSWGLSRRVGRLGRLKTHEVGSSDGYGNTSQCTARSLEPVTVVVSVHGCQ